MHTQVAGLHTHDLSQNIFIYNSNGGLLGERVRERVSDVGLLGGGVNEDEWWCFRDIIPVNFGG